MSAPFARMRVGVGVGVFVTSERHPSCVLLGIRKGKSSGCGQYALPGGHLEFGEEWDECAARETLEETGLTLTNIRYQTVVNAVERESNYHYITLFMRGEVDDACLLEPENLEPEKCEGWFWCDWEKFPPLEKLFCALRVARMQGFNPFNSPIVPDSEADNTTCIAKSDSARVQA